MCIMESDIVFDINDLAHIMSVILPWLGACLALSARLEPYLSRVRAADQCALQVVARIGSAKETSEDRLGHEAAK